MVIFGVEIPMWMFWLVVAGGFLVLELITTALVSIWFVPASVLAGIVSLFVDSIMVQGLVFIAVSCVCFPILKNFYEKKLKQPKIFEQSVVGKTGIVTVPVTKYSGRIVVGDVNWEARTSGETIPENTIVQVTDVNGLIVQVVAVIQ